MNYKHVQKVPKDIMAGIGLAGLALGLTPPGFLMRFLVLGALGSAAAVFHSMTIELDDEALTWFFGENMLKKRIPLSELVSARTFRTKPYQGWGIHHLGNGWLYNVYGCNAVDIEMTDGEHLYLGTDEPDALVNAIDQRVKSV